MAESSGPVPDGTFEYSIREALDAGLTHEGPEAVGDTVDVAMMQIATGFSALVGAQLQGSSGVGIRNDIARAIVERNGLIDHVFFRIGADSLKGPFYDVVATLLAKTEEAANLGGRALEDVISERWQKRLDPDQDTSDSDSDTV